MSDRRQRPRARVAKNAKLIVAERSLVDCTVRDLTNVGAGVELSSANDLSEAIGLTFDGGRSIRPCRIVWRELRHMGLKFS